jgi:hypothetical protein
MANLNSWPRVGAHALLSRGLAFVVVAYLRSPRHTAVYYWSTGSSPDGQRFSARVAINDHKGRRQDREVAAEPIQSRSLAESLTPAISCTLIRQALAEPEMKTEEQRTPMRSHGRGHGQSRPG